MTPPKHNNRTTRRYFVAWSSTCVFFVAAGSGRPIHAFTILPPPSPPTAPLLHRRQRLLAPQKFPPLRSSVGDGPPKPPSENSWGDFLDPKEESENLRKARDYMSEESLPISFDENNNDDSEGGEEKQEAAGDEDDDMSTFLNSVKDNNDDDDSEEEDDILRAAAAEAAEASSALVPGGAASSLSPGGSFEAPTADTLANNPYLAVVTKLTPSELISKFTATANPRVQDAVRTTILGLIGGLPKLAFETTTITTGQRLASLMFQLQMTGYMFKNAEYRLSLQQSLGIMDLDAVSEKSGFLLPGEGGGEEDDDDDDPLSGKIRGKLKLRYKAKSEDDAGTTDNKDKSGSDKDNDVNEENNGDDDDDGVEVDAEAYMSELRSEVSRLRDELTETRQAKEEAIRKDLLLYIRTLPEQKLRSLTNDMSQDILVAMKGLVNAVLSGIGEGKLGPDTVTEQSGEALAQLCMWQLVVGYNLRELEVREEMKNSMFNSSSDGGEKGADDAAAADGGVDFSEPGTLE